MTRIPLQALVTDAEAPAVSLAARQLSQALSAAAGEAYLVELQRGTSAVALAPVKAGGLLIASLLDEALNPARPWEGVEMELRRLCRDLAPSRTLYLLTVFRHVAADNDIAAARLRRTRIRRLNLLAAELSRETGLFVIDLDRALADIGAAGLETDYRLAGDRAVEVAALTIAQTLLTTGLDAFVPFEIQEAARPLLTPERTTPAAVMPTNILAVRSGRRTQSAEVRGRKEDQVALYTRQVLRGRMRLRDVAQVVAKAIARRGLWYCLGLVGREALRTLRGRRAAASQGGH